MIAGDPLIICGPGSRVTGWNDAAASLTGMPAEVAAGQPCWSVLRGVDPVGTPVCRPGCTYARRARAGRPLPAHDLLIPVADGSRRRVRASMLSLEGPDPGTYAIVLQDRGAPGAPEGADPPPAPDAIRLTPREREVLELLAAGIPVRSVAQRLGLSEATVRNYVRRIFMALRCHSQLEAVAVARRAGLI